MATASLQEPGVQESSGTEPDTSNNNNNNNNTVYTVLHPSRLHSQAGNETKLRFRRFRKKSKQGSPQQSKSMSSRSVKFHRLFDIAESEILIRTFPCALKAEILLQGTFYVSANYFCFRARLAGKKKSIKISVGSICEITREKTAIFFPNAIGIRTQQDRFVFGSILSRDSTFKLLWQLWKAASVETEANSNGSNKLQDEINHELPSPFSIKHELQRSNSDSLLYMTKFQTQPKLKLEAAAAATVAAAAAAAAAAENKSECTRQSSTCCKGTQFSSSPSQPSCTAWKAVELRCQQHLRQLLLFLKSHLRSMLADNQVTVGCSMVIACLLYVLYLAYQIHVIQRTISCRLDEILQADGSGQLSQ